MIAQGALLLPAERGGAKSAATVVGDCAACAAAVIEDHDVGDATAVIIGDCAGSR